MFKPPAVFKGMCAFRTLWKVLNKAEQSVGFSNKQQQEVCMWFMFVCMCVCLRKKYIFLTWKVLVICKYITSLTDD